MENPKTGVFECCPLYHTDTSLYNRGRTVKGKLGFFRGKYASQWLPGGRHASPRSGIHSLLFQFRFNSGIKAATLQWKKWRK